MSLKGKNVRENKGRNTRLCLSTEEISTSAAAAAANSYVETLSVQANV